MGPRLLWYLCLSIPEATGFPTMISFSHMFVRDTRDTPATHVKLFQTRYLETTTEMVIAGARGNWR